MTNRRSFLKQAGSGLALTGVGPVVAAAPDHLTSPTAGVDTFRLGIAGYSFLHFTLDQSLAMMQKLDVHHLCIKDFHLPFASTPEQITAFQEKLKKADVTGYAIGPIYMKTRPEIDNAFDYARRVGVDLIVGIPNVEDLPYVEQKVKAFNIRYAIHNHGPDGPLYPNAESVYSVVKDLDPRLGLCLDIGHDKRYGNDPLADLEKYAKRVFDIHLKNVTAPTKEGKTCELGRGIIDIPAFVGVLRKVKYSGQCGLEYEKDMKDPLAGIAESVGYFRGVCDAGQPNKRRS